MKRLNSIYYGLIGILVGGTIVWLIMAYSINSCNIKLMQIMGIYSQQYINRLCEQDNFLKEIKEGYGLEDIGSKKIETKSPQK